MGKEGQEEGKEEQEEGEEEEEEKLKNEAIVFLELNSEGTKIESCSW